MSVEISASVTLVSNLTHEGTAPFSAGHFWGTYSVDLGPYADGLDQYTFPTNGQQTITRNFFTCSNFLAMHSENLFVLCTGVRYVRYMQWGVWSAIFRPHDGGNDDTRIWMFAEPYASILRDCTRLRGALTPYVYTLAAKSSNESWPFSRPMWWDYGYSAATGKEVDEAWSVPSQYLFGDILVNPVTNWVNPNSSTMNTTALTTANKTTWLPEVRDRTKRNDLLQLSSPIDQSLRMHGVGSSLELMGWARPMVCAERSHKRHHRGQACGYASFCASGGSGGNVAAREANDRTAQSHEGIRDMDGSHRQ